MSVCLLPYRISFAKSSQAELLSLHRGQGLEILWRDSLRCPSEEEYIQMVNNSERFDSTRYNFSNGAKKRVDYCGWVSGL